jgi:hypothetical protein
LFDGRKVETIKIHATNHQKYIGTILST